MPHRTAPSPALNVCRAPCKIFGDVHGQFRDLLLFFVEFGCPSHRCGDIESPGRVPGFGDDDDEEKNVC